jgi:acyl-CoA reductase-like NAD-dependent aldehyde dehydrogenase
MKDESFGPIIGIQKVSSDEEAVNLMNDSYYGLTAGVYTPNRSRAEKLLPKIQSGTVYWNACDRVSPFLPWGGNSGNKRLINFKRS